MHVCRLGKWSFIIKEIALELSCVALGRHACIGCSTRQDLQWVLFGQFEPRCLGRSWAPAEPASSLALLHTCWFSQFISLELATVVRACDQAGPKLQAYRGQKMVLDPLELELQIVWKHHDNAGNPPLVLWFTHSPALPCLDLNALLLNTWSHSVAQAGPELSMYSLSQMPQCWDHSVTFF